MSTDEQIRRAERRAYWDRHGAEARRMIVAMVLGAGVGCILNALWF